jgi:tetratricopeptide (TPR) repeat protein
MPRKKSTHIDDPAAAGHRLREARERAGLSQRELAFPGCSPSYVSRIEAGTRIGSPRILRELAHRLSVTEEYLATGALTSPLTLLGDAQVALQLDRVAEAASLYEDALKDARDSAERAQALEGLGQVAYRSGDPELAVDLFQRALEGFQLEAADRPTLAESLGRAYAELGRLDDSISVFQAFLDRAADDPVQYVRVAALLAAALTDAGRLDDAEALLSSAIERGRTLPDAYTRARLHWTASRLSGEQGQLEASARHARHALELLRETEDTYAIAHALQSLASAYLDLGRSREALELLDEGREPIEQLGTPLEIAQYRMEEARALAGMGELDAAATLAFEAGNELQGTHPVDTARAYTLLAEICARVGAQERAHELLELAIEILEAQAPNRHLVRAYRQLAAVLRTKGDLEGALAVLERALEVHEHAPRATRAS